jgi:hypothetical protein
MTARKYRLKFSFLIGALANTHLQALNLGPCVARVICFLDHVLDLGLRRVKRVFVDQPGFGIIEFKGSLVHLETPIRGILATTIAQCLHFRRSHRYKVLCDFKILLEDVRLFGARDGAGHRKTHGVTQRFPGGKDTHLHWLPMPADRLHA